MRSTDSAPRNNNYMVDGSDNNDVTTTIATSQIVPEAVAEFQVQTSSYSAEFGRNTGGQINVITRSGTNRFRGDVWEYWTGSRFYSLDNLEKASGLTEPAKYNRHQAGGAVGGPVLRDKLFFFGLYQADPQRTAERPSTTVRIPTQAGYAGAAERAARSRPAGIEPAGGPSEDRIPSGRVRAEPELPEPLHDHGQRRADRNGTNQSEHRRSEHLSQRCSGGPTTGWAAPTTSRSATR